MIIPIVRHRCESYWDCCSPVCAAPLLLMSRQCPDGKMLCFFWCVCAEISAETLSSTWAVSAYVCVCVQTGGVIVHNIPIWPMRGQSLTLYFCWHQSGPSVSIRSQMTELSLYQCLMEVCKEEKRVWFCFYRTNTCVCRHPSFPWRGIWHVTVIKGMNEVQKSQTCN